ncbi:muts domain V-domain-containing protein [Trametes elegans]|nr:muts domain V-domain-containing protein [Trametes elegans]
MCGFPLMHLNKYLKQLVQEHNRFVAMCEEFPRDPAIGAKGGFDRRVVRIVTPVYPSSHPVGLAWIDVSTGEFYTKNTTLSGLRDEVVRICPKEVVLDERISKEGLEPIQRVLAEEGCFVSYYAPRAVQSPDVTSLGQSNPDELTLEVQNAEGLPPAPLVDEESRAVELLTAFMHANLMEHMPSLSSPAREATSGRMQIDSHTVKALEIREGLREGGTTGSLLSVVKRTVTTSGTRLLARWLCSPSTSVSEINARQSLVAFFHARPYLREDVVQILRDAEDATRIVQKFVAGRGSFGDLSAICTTLDIWASIKARILAERELEQQERGAADDADWASIMALMERLSDLNGLSGKIRVALAQRRMRFLRARRGWKSSLRVRGQRQSGSPGIRWVSSNGRSGLTAPSLSLRASPGQGMHVHIARKKDAARLRDKKDFVALSESGSTCTFFHRGWSQLAAQISETTFAISNAEKEAFEIMRNEVTAHASELRLNARIVDELDVTLAFANLAAEMRFVRPIVDDSTSYHVVNGRHPTVELGLLTSGRGFTPNTVTFTSESQLHIITGPNMAGKSTLLRQTALIAILAQTGSVFSRVGAKDDLFRDRSTFMVEMLEASDILRRATPRSLVIMDEVGRGTTVEDGLAIAFGAVHHLLAVNGCRAMFATHFHELADMLGYDSASHRGQGPFSKVAFYCTDVDEIENGYFAYSHRLSPGVNRDSHGLKVAQLAGMPDAAIRVARSALSWLKQRSAERAGSRHDLHHALGQTLAADRQ